MANGLGGHEDGPRAVAVFSGTSTREGVVRRTHTRDDAGHTLVYDAWRRLVQVKRGGTVLASYGYDALGRRITQSGGTATDLYYSAGRQVLEEGRGGRARVQYVWSPVGTDTLVGRDRDPSGGGTLSERLYARQGASGDVTALVNTSGDVVGRYVYDPYGQPTFLTASRLPGSGGAVGWLYLDLRPHRPGPGRGIRGPLPPGPRQPVAPGVALDAAAADPAGHPAGRGGHPPLAGRGLARPGGWARRERRVLVFEDESGFYLLPGVVRTYAPEAQTPVLREMQTRDRLSVMGGMTPAGKVYTLVRQESLDGWHGIAFLLHRRRVAGGRLLAIWDGSPIPRRAEVKEFVSGTRGKVWLEALPGYAPDLNPWDEGGWHHLKDVEMRNRVCRDLEELHQEFRLAVGRRRQKPHLVISCLAQAGLKL